MSSVHAPVFSDEIFARRPATRAERPLHLAVIERIGAVRLPGVAGSNADKTQLNVPRRTVDFLVLGLLSLLVHAFLLNSGLRPQAAPEELVQPPKIPQMTVELSRPAPAQAAAPVPPQAAKPPPPKPQPRTAPAPTPTPVAAAQASPAPAAPQEAAPAAAPAAAPTAAPATSRAVASDAPVTPPIGRAGYLSNPAPKYPELAVRRGWSGEVLLRVHVLASGRPDQVGIERSSGRKVLDDAAVATVTNWVFAPAKRGNAAIDGWVTVPIEFKLDD